VPPLPVRFLGQQPAAAVEVVVGGRAQNAHAAQVGAVGGEEAAAEEAGQPFPIQFVPSGGGGHGGHVCAHRRARAVAGPISVKRGVAVRPDVPFVGPPVVGRQQEMAVQPGDARPSFQHVDHGLNRAGQTVQFAQ